MERGVQTVQNHGYYVDHAFFSNVLLEMARKQMKTRKGRKHRTHKVRRHRGGGWGFTGASSIPGTPGTVSNPQVFTGIGDCRAVKPGYDIPYSQYANSFKGLPGMNGGKRSRKNKNRNQRGGRYGFAPDMIPGVTPNGAAWWGATYGPVQRIACEGSTPNPLNLGPHTPSTQPLPVASSRIPMPQGGGAQLAPATYGVGNVDSMYHYSPTAGYANSASTWKDSVGAPVQIQVPFAARAMNQACLSTGGHPPLTGALQQAGGKRSRKQRGGENNNNNLSKNGKGWLNSIKTTLFGNNNVVDISGANVTIPPGAPVGNTNGANVPRTNLNRNNGNNGNPPLPPMTMGGKHKGRKHRKGKKSRKAKKGSRKH